MIDERYSIAISETLYYLKGISEEDIKKIPDKLMEFLKLNSAKDYQCNFDYTKPLNELKLKNETRGIIAMICLNCWCETEEQKSNFIKHLSNNEDRYQEEFKKKYNIDKLIYKNDIFARDENIKIANLLPQKENNILKKIFNYILNFFHIKDK